MKLIKVKFTEFRDPSSGADPAAGTELLAAQKKLDELAAREAEARADLAHAEGLLKKAKSAQLSERMSGHVMELDNIHVARKAALQAAQAAGEAQAAAMKSHPRVGTFGYQVLDETETRVERLVDADGKDLPEGAVYGTEVVDVKPDAPAWAQEGRK